ncbi:hypothetical protein V5799_009782, partial [Amblyomma americanum]
MASEDDFTEFRKHFTDEEWKGLWEYMRTAPSNIKEKYELMLKLGLKPPRHEFMKPKPAPPIPAKPPTKSNSPSPETSSSGSGYPRHQRKEAKRMECEENSDQEYLSSPETSSSGSGYPRHQRKEAKRMECEENSDQEYL